MARFRSDRNSRKGDLMASSLKGDLMASSLKGDLIASSLKGDLIASSLKGDLMASSLKGDLMARFRSAPSSRFDSKTLLSRLPCDRTLSRTSLLRSLVELEALSKFAMST